MSKERVPVEKWIPHQAVDAADYLDGPTPLLYEEWLAILDGKERDALVQAMEAQQAVIAELRAKSGLTPPGGWDEPVLPEVEAGESD